MSSPDGGWSEWMASQAYMKKNAPESYRAYWLGVKLSILVSIVMIIGMVLFVIYAKPIGLWFASHSN
jgi:Na+-driven multidrug efflux pump